MIFPVAKIGTLTAYLGRSAMQYRRDHSTSLFLVTPYGRTLILPYINIILTIEILLTQLHLLVRFEKLDQVDSVNCRKLYDINRTGPRSRVGYVPCNHD